MSHRTFRSIAGSSILKISAITGLALGLACGGGNQVINTPENPEPTIPGVNCPDVAINGHRYKITASSKDAVSWYVTHSNSASDLESTGKGEWYYTPKLGGDGRGSETLTFRSINADQKTSEPTEKVIQVNLNNAPTMPDRLKGENPVIYVSKTLEAFVAGLPSTDADGDAITWGVGSGSFNNNSNRGLAVADNTKGQIRFNAASVPADGRYDVEILYSEKSNGVTVWRPTLEYTRIVTVVVGANSDGADVAAGMRPENSPNGKVTFVQSGDFIVGIPKVFKFESEDQNNKGFQAATWSLTNADSTKWIATSGQVEIPSGLGGENMRLSLANDKHPDYQTFRSMRPGYGVFIPQSAGSASLNVTAGFADKYGTINSSDNRTGTGTVTIRANTAPALIGDITSQVIIAPQGMPAYTNKDTEIPLVFKGPTQGNVESKDIRSIITFTGQVFDPDLSKGDIVTFELAGVYVDKWSESWGTAEKSARIIKNPGAKIGKISPTFEPSVLTSSMDVATIQGSITLDMLPLPEDTFTYGDSDISRYDHSLGLSFVYTMKDMGGNEKQFAIHVKTRENRAPIFDAYDDPDHTFNSGDIVKKDGGWADQRPSVGSTTEWTIEWGDPREDTPGAVPADFKIADPDGDAVYMAQGTGTGASNNLSVTFTSPQYREPAGDISVAGPFTFKWQPSGTAWEGAKYTFYMNAWDRYGYAAVPLKMTGVVYRTINGKSVKKWIYRAADSTRSSHVDSKDADFSNWASIHLNLFYASDKLSGTDKDNINAYMSDLPDNPINPEANGRRYWWTASVGDNSKWAFANVPPGPYLVSTDRQLGNTVTATNDTNAPLVGPAVTNANMSDYGHTKHSSGTTNATFFGSNYYAYAYIDSSSPDLTTYAGSGILAGNIDMSLGAEYYNFKLADASPLPDMGGVTYTGAMGNIHSNKTIDPSTDAVQFTFPSIAQSGFFGDAYPSAKYPETLGWADYTTPVVLPAFTGDQITIANLSLAIPYQTTKNDKIQLSAMKQAKKDSNSGISLRDYPYWTMVTSGIASNGTEQPITTSPVQQVTSFGATTNSGSFNATVNRTRFRASLNLQAPWDSSSTGWGTSSAPGAQYANVTDTLQVKAYVNGTTLGPDSHAGLPTLLEFGNFNEPKSPAVASGADLTTLTNFDGTVNLGSIPIPKPNPTYWNAGADTPVVSYIATFNSPSGLMGSMGLITADMSSGITRQVTPATNVKITGISDYGETLDLKIGKAPSHAAAGIYVSNYLSGSTLTSPKNINTTTGKLDGTNAPIIAKAFTDDDTENPKVWLSWTNASGENISGNIIEFFKYTGSDLTADSLPHYVVHVSPNYDEFPIPNNWVKVLGADANGAVVRIRTVRYGPNNSTRINFNEEPFKKALPYAWAETITAVIKFDGIFP